MPLGRIGGYIKGLIINRHYSENLPSPLFSKEGYYSSLWQREVRRDFIKQCFHYYETVNN
jgi:hypothetical protein